MIQWVSQKHHTEALNVRVLWIWPRAMFVTLWLCIQETLVVSFYLFPVVLELLYKLILSQTWSVSAVLHCSERLLVEALLMWWWGLGRESFVCLVTIAQPFSMAETQHSDLQQGLTLGSSPWSPPYHLTLLWGKEARKSCHRWPTLLPSGQRRTLTGIFPLEYDWQGRQSTLGLLQRFPFHLLGPRQSGIALLSSMWWPGKVPGGVKQR